MWFKLVGLRLLVCVCCLFLWFVCGLLLGWVWVCLICLLDLLLDLLLRASCLCFGVCWFSLVDWFGVFACVLFLGVLLLVFGLRCFLVLL